MTKKQLICRQGECRSRLLATITLDDKGKVAKIEKHRSLERLDLQIGDRYAEKIGRLLVHHDQPAAVGRLKHWIVRH